MRVFPSSRGRAARARAASHEKFPWPEPFKAAVRRSRPVKSSQRFTQWTGAIVCTRTRRRPSRATGSRGHVALCGVLDRATRSRLDRGDTTTPTPDSGGSDNGGSNSGGSGGTSGSTSPESGEDVNGDGSIDKADGEVAASVSDAAREATKMTGERTLPVTGGVTPLPLFAASAGLLMAGGLLIRRTSRR